MVVDRRPPRSGRFHTAAEPRAKQFQDRLSEAGVANLNYLATSLPRTRTDDMGLERMRREAGFASNNAEEVLARLRLERLRPLRLTEQARPRSL